MEPANVNAGRAKDEMQKRVDAANDSFDAALERKEKEIQS